MVTIIKGLDILNKYLNDWLRNHKFYCKSDLGTDFEYENDNRILYYSLAAPEKGSEYFINFAESLGLKYNLDFFILAFFHELGHYKTLDSLIDEELDRRLPLLEKLSIKENPTRKDFYRYYNLPEELSATMWAVEFINKHPRMIKRFWDNVQKIILEIYKANEVDLNE